MSAPTGRRASRSGTRPSHGDDRTRSLRALVAVGTAAGVVLCGLALTASVWSGQHDAVDQSVAMVSQTDVLARTVVAQTVDRGQQRVSRDVARVTVSEAAAAQAEAAARQRAAATKATADAAERARDAAAEKKRLAVVADAKSNPRAVARSLMSAHGWSGEAQYGCLVNLWNGESSWTWSALNTGSGAYGIPQSLPAGKMARFGSDYRTNPVTQIKWGLWYIETSYGSPCNAWSTWQSRSPRWY